MTRSLFALALLATRAVAQEDTWNRIYAVTSRARCTNCHVGSDGVPMWSDLIYGVEASHGVNVQAGEGRIGAETIPCLTCHMTIARPVSLARAAPRIDDAWRLPPVELQWLGKSSGEVCAQLRGGDETVAELIERVRESPFVAGGFVPGGHRPAPDGTPETLARDILQWGKAGKLCPGDQ